MAPLPPNPLGVDVVSTAAAGLFIDIIFISMRLWSRRLKNKKLVIGDYLIITACFLAFGDFIRKIIAYKWGVGLHIYQILATDPSHLLDAAKITWAGYFIWVAAVTCIKLSILCMYLELFGRIRWFIWCVQATMGLCILYYIGFSIGLCVQCTPFAANYNSSIPGSKCGLGLADGFFISGAINLFIDIVLIILPMPVVWSLNITWMKKIGVSAMFSFGLMILVVVGIRFKLISDENIRDFIHDGEPAGILISLELYLGMISASLPFLSPPLAQVRSYFSRKPNLAFVSGAVAESATQRPYGVSDHHEDFSSNRLADDLDQNGSGKGRCLRSKRSDEETMVGSEKIEAATVEIGKLSTTATEQQIPRIIGTNIPGPGD